MCPFRRRRALQKTTSVKEEASGSNGTESGSAKDNGDKASQEGPGRLSKLNLFSRTLASGGGNNRASFFVF